MVSLGRKIYYHNQTGQVIVERGECSGDVKETTIEEDMKTYPVIKLYQDEISCLKLEYGELSWEFNKCIAYKIDLVSLRPQFLFRTEP